MHENNASKRGSVLLCCHCNNNKHLMYINLLILFLFLLLLQCVNEYSIVRTVLYVEMTAGRCK